MAAPIANQPDMEVVGQAADAKGSVEEVALRCPDVVLLDIRVPGDGLVALTEIRRVAPDAKVIIVTQYEDALYLRRALTSGASGYLLKRSGGIELLRAIRSVRDGGVYLDPFVAHYMVEGLCRDPRRATPAEPLSKREKEVLRCLALGMTSQQIAEALAIGVRTVETYKERLAEKIGVKGRAALVRYAIESGLIGPGEGND